MSATETLIFAKGEDFTNQWANASAQYDEKEDHLEIMGKPVMEKWETPYMHALADIAARKGGRILEIGFGLGIAASRVETHPVDDHVIIECNDDVFLNLEKFAKDAPNKVTPLKGLWQTVVTSLESESFDGILYDTYPLSEETWHTHQFEFIKAHAERLLKPGGTLTYCNLTSWGKLMKERFNDVEVMFKETQIPSLLESGFKRDNISWNVVDIQPEAECKYYNHTKIVAPVIVK